MLEMQFPDAKKISLIFQSLSKIVDEINVNFDKEKAKIVAMDPAHVCMLVVNLHSSSFTNYNVDEKKILGFNINSLLKILKGVRKQIPITIKMQEEPFVEIQLRDNVYIKANIRTLDVAFQDIPEPQLEYQVKAIVNSSALKNAIEQIEGVTDILWIEADESKLSLYSEGNSRISIELEKELQSVLELSVVEKSKCGYNVTYLGYVNPLYQISDYVEMKFGNDKPLEMRFGIDENSYADFLLAPSS
jgi:proliferating cell nuclear antigen